MIFIFVFYNSIILIFLLTPHGVAGCSGEKKKKSKHNESSTNLTSSGTSSNNRTASTTSSRRPNVANRIDAPSQKDQESSESPKGKNLAEEWKLQEAHAQGSDVKTDLRSINESNPLAKISSSKVKQKLDRRAQRQEINKKLKHITLANKKNKGNRTNRVNANNVADGDDLPLDATPKSKSIIKENLNGKLPNPNKNESNTNLNKSCYI